MKDKKNSALTVAVLITAIIAIGGYYFPQALLNLGAEGTRFPNGLAVGTSTSIGYRGILKVGTNGANLWEVKAATCNLTTTVLRTSLATSTLPFNCAVTGVASGDVVFATLPSDGGSVTDGINKGGIQLRYATASSTAGNIEIGLSNDSGAATSSYSGATTSVQILYIDN